MLITEDTRRELRFGAGFWALGSLSVLAMVPVLVEHGGFRFGAGGLLAVQLSNFAFVAIFAGEFITGFLRSGDRRSFLKAELVEAALLVGLVLMLVLVVFRPLGLFHAPGLRGAVIPAQIYLLGNLIIKVLTLFKVAASRRFNYARAFGVSFLVIILVGALLLYLLPGTKAPGKDLGFVDALFTSTSATCVTGLITVDTGTQFSRFGQIIILILFQVGGLGLMTFAAFFAIALGKGMGIKDREVMRGVLNLDVMGKIVKVIVGILIITVCFEAVGAMVLYGQWSGDLTPDDRAFHSIFHSVSAFCNAGFSLMGDSLEGYVTNPLVNGTVMLLIVMGGLGFGVVLELLGLPLFGLRVLRRMRRPVDDFDQLPRPRLGVQTRIVLISSAVLILGGALLLYALEYDNPATLGALSDGEKVQAALFQSVTARTAGFNTLPVGEMTAASKFLTSALMMVGASPGSTGGGLKTVTAVVLLLSVLAVLRGRGRVELFRRALPQSTVQKAGIIVVLSVAFVFCGTLILTVTEAGRLPFLDIFFEVCSAFGTVGLSTGITAELSTVSKLTIAVIMLVGRIGPLSLVIALSQGGAPRKYEYPVENVMIG
jgi:trk/ktr system potassium uptake protein